MSLAEHIKCFAATDVGRKRTHNEDTFLVDEELGLFVVADGMGGHAAGEIASNLAVETVHEIVAAQRDTILQHANEGARSEVGTRQILEMLEYAVQTASQRIHAAAHSDAKKRGMGTTITLLLVAGANAYAAHVGDSRIYLVREGVVHQVTEDHTVANELLRLGMITRDQLHRIPRKNAITRAVGVYQHAEVDTLTLEVLPHDQFLLSSDGLGGYIDETGVDMRPFLTEEHGSEAVKRLIAFANEQGGKDNITVLLVRLGGGDVSDSARARRVQLKREVLAALPLFARLNERELLRVMQVAEVAQYDTGEVVVREGELGDRMFVTLQGRLKVSRGTTPLDELGRGEQVGEMALIRSSPRSATVTAIEPSELISLTRTDFFEIIRTEPHVAVKLLWQFLGVLADRLEQTSQDLLIVREELTSEAEVSTERPVPSSSVEDPFSQPVPPRLGGFRLGFGAPPEAVPVTLDDHEEAPGLADAPAMVPRIDDPTSWDSDPHVTVRRGLPLRPETVSMVHSADDPPSWDSLAGEIHRDDTPSFDKAPEIARRLDDHPSWDSVPEAAKSPAVIDAPGPKGRTPFDASGPRGPEEFQSWDRAPIDGEPDTRRRIEAVAKRIEEDDDGVPFDAKRTRPGVKTKAPAVQARDAIIQARVRSPTLPSAGAPSSATPGPAGHPATPEPVSRVAAPPAAAKSDISVPPPSFNSITGPPPPPPPRRAVHVTTEPGLGIPAKQKPGARADLKTVPDPVEAKRQRTTVPQPARGFKPSRETIPLEPSPELKEDLDALRAEFKERLKKSRRERGEKDSD